MLGRIQGLHPQSIWPAIQERMLEQISRIKTGSVEDFDNFMNAVIDEKAFDISWASSITLKNQIAVKSLPMAG